MLAALLFALATENLVALNDLGPAPYAFGYYGGLYEGGSNTIPADHLAAGLARAALVRPLDRDGQPSQDGKIVFLTAGFGETERITDSLMAMEETDPRVDHRSLVIVNGAHEGFDASAWYAPRAAANFDRIQDQILAPRELTEKQVQVAWVQMIANANDSAPPLPRQDADAYRVKGYIATALRNLKTRYPNLQVAYLSSRVYAGYGSQEPYAYESALSVRWVILGQVTLMRTGFLWDTRIADVNYETGVAPWAAWGPYLWANGSTPRSDGLTWERDDFEDDGESLTEKGARKGATLLLDFLLNEPTAAMWLRSPHGPLRMRAIR